MVSMLKNSFYRFNRWLDRNETFKFLFIVSIVACGMINIQFGNLFLGVFMILSLTSLGLYRILIHDGMVKFDRSKYQVPQVGEIVVVKKDFYYDGSFRKFINTSDQSQKPNWWKVPKGTELVILNVDEDDGDWKIRFIEPTFNSQTKGSMNLYYLDTKDYWDTKSNIRNKLLKKLGI